MTLKKIFLSLCAVVTLSAIACNKDIPQPTEPVDTTPTEQPQIEGIFDPACKISIITYSDGTAPELWQWNVITGLLMSVDDGNFCGGSSEKVQFAYNADGRVNTVTLTDANSENVPLLGILRGTVAIGYEGNHVSTLSLTDEGKTLMTADVQHDGNKVSGAILNPNDIMITEIFNSTIAQFLGGSFSDDLVTTVDSASGRIAFIWDGENVSQSRMTISFHIGSTLGRIRQILGDDMGIFGEHTQYLADQPDNLPLFFTVAMGDTANYTYDDMENPYHGFLGRAHISILTTNNVTSEEHLASATVSITTSLQGNNIMQIYKNSIPLPSPTYSYQYDQYNELGFPVKKTDSEGVVSRYVYMQ